jgi:peptidoglycan/xylan/chitin deacetylase (PgdA/CDA1 family)
MQRVAIAAVAAVLIGSLAVGSTARPAGAGERRVAGPPPAASSCPAPLSGPQFYAPGIRGGAKTIALTFDDGPGPSTPRIIAILRSFGVRATFFNIGASETRWPGEVREEGDDGFLVGSHTWDHPDMTTLPVSAQATELDRVAREQRSLIGSSPCVFRPPYGDYDSTLLALAKERRMAVWMWSVDTEDWKARGSGSSYWVNRIISLAESEGAALHHPVVIMHNQSIPMPATVAALPTIIRFFQRRGYTFVDLLGRTGPPGTCGSAPGTFPRPRSTIVRSGARLASGAALASPGGQYRLTMRTDGDLVLTAQGGRALWDSATSGHTGAIATMQRNGDFVVSTTGRRTLWSSRTMGHAGAVFELRSDGGLAVAVAAGPVWSTQSTQTTLTQGERLEPSWFLESPNHACRLIMQANGDLVLYSASRQPLWSSGTSGSPDTIAVLQRNGDFALLSRTGQALFSSGTPGHEGSVLTLARRSQAIVLTRSGRTLWATG